MDDAAQWEWEIANELERLAEAEDHGAAESEPVLGDMEILTLAGTLGAQGSHLHATLARSNGTVFGGHVAYGCIVRTTAEVLVALLPEWEFRLEPDPLTGYDELVVRRAAGRSG